MHYEALGRQMKRFEPRAVVGEGLIGFHMQVGLRTPIWKIETVRGRERWASRDLDRLAGLIAYLTTNDHPGAQPLPLWYAQRLVRMPKEVLITYQRETLRMIREQTVERAWLEGLEAIEEGE